MAYTDPEPGGFGSSDNPDLSNQWKQDRYNQWLNSQGGSGGNYGGGGGIMSADQLFEQIRGAVLEAQNLKDEPYRKFNEYLETNPFAFDENLAKLSAEERFDPYYNAELNDYITGVTRQRERSISDDETIRKELTASTESYLGTAKRKFEDALDQTKEGYSGVGLYHSGERFRKEEDLGTDYTQDTTDYQRKSDLQAQNSLNSRQRALEDLQSGEDTYRRKWTADRTTAIDTDVSGQKQEEQKRRLFEASQYAGGEVASQYLQNNPLLI